MKRMCLCCYVDLSDVTGVYVFTTTGPTSQARTDYLLCLSCGVNGKNGMSVERFEELCERFERETS